MVEVMVEVMVKVEVKVKRSIKFILALASTFSFVLAFTPQRF